MAKNRRATLIVLGGILVAAEDFDRGEALDVVGTADGLVLGHVDGADLDESLQSGGGFGVLGDEILAVAAPWGVEFDYPDRVVLNDALLEVGRGQFDDGRRLIVQGEGRRSQRCKETNTT